MGAGLALALVGYAAAASAAEPSAMLRQMQGRVFVSQATTMGLARDGMPLYVGNRVVAVAGGGAQVVYANGCTVAIPANSVLAIGGADQCRAGQALVRSTAGFQSKAIGQALSPPVLALYEQFDTLASDPLVTAYNGLTGAQQAELVAALSENQLTKLYLAISTVSGKGGAQALLALLTPSQSSALMTGVAAAKVAGITIGGVFLSATQVVAIVLGVGAVTGIIVGTTQSDDGSASP